MLCWQYMLAIEGLFKPLFSLPGEQKLRKSVGKKKFKIEQHCFSPGNRSIKIDRMSRSKPDRSKPRVKRIENLLFFARGNKTSIKKMPGREVGDQCLRAYNHYRHKRCLKESTCIEGGFLDSESLDHEAFRHYQQKLLRRASCLCFSGDGRPFPRCRLSSRVPH
jgi:hypothetical protein